MNLLVHICITSMGEVVGAFSYQYDCALEMGLSVCGRDCDKHQDFSVVAIASWEAIDWVAVMLTNCLGDASANTNLWLRLSPHCPSWI